MSLVQHVNSSRPNCAEPLSTQNSGSSDSFGRKTLQAADDQDVKLLNNKEGITSLLIDSMARNAMAQLSPSVFNGVLGPTNKYIPLVTFEAHANAKCYACQVDCLKKWKGLAERALFKSCKYRYFYYGCDRPCYGSHTASQKDTADMIAICHVRNDCRFGNVLLDYAKKYKKKAMSSIVWDIGTAAQNTRAD